MAVLSSDDVTWVRFGSAPLIVTLLLPIVIGVILLLKCILNHCCVRKTTTKEEMYGVEGRMTILSNAESSFVSSSQSQSQNQPPSVVTSIAAATTATNTTATNLYHQFENSENSVKIVSLINPTESAADASASVSISAVDGIQLPSDSYETVDLTDSLKRTTHHRQLPDLPQIPQQIHNPPRRSSSVLSHDGTSELYATVGEVPNPVPSTLPTSATAAAGNHYSNVQRQNPNKTVLPSTSRSLNLDGASTTKSIKSNQNEPTPSSDSETYATNHPYAKLKRSTAEHPYARVRTASIGNDEETDTDNYDIPQPYAQTRGRPHTTTTTTIASTNSQQSSNNDGISQPSASSSGSANLNSNEEEGNGPVPPRRVGRPWRRSSHPQVQNNDNQSHFSGDSQDSRGYTSISVREPLSNIRSQVTSTRNYDSHYATVSDDSEEMYAAIEDAEGNYMRIPGEEGDSRHPWLERREANSPLPPVPPVPAVPPPEVSPTGSGVVTSPVVAVQSLPIAPVYAQVTKKSKKGKAPVTPTASNASASSQTQPKENPTNENEATPLSSITLPSITASTSKGTKHQHQSSRNRHTIMENTNVVNPLDPTMTEPRRWSKADISYSEFDVVRESLYTSSVNSNENSSEPVPLFDNTANTRDSIKSKCSDPAELLDEDNYNVIPENSAGRASRGSGGSSGRSKSRTHKISDSGNYQEIEHFTNPYHEIQPKSKEPSDHYQEIESKTQNGETDAASLYQEIEREKSADYEEEDEDEEDQFYERVKPSAKVIQSKSIPSLSPSSADSLDRKHGYEKLKKKVTPSYSNLSTAGKVATASDEEDDEEDNKQDGEDSLYERVKYPPYERLKESRDDLVDGVNDSEDGNLYEDIGYSRVKPKHKRGDKALEKETTCESKTDGSDLTKGNIHSSEKLDELSTVVDLDQLYARVDKTKKKKNTSSSSKLVDSSQLNDSIVTISTNPSLSGEGNMESLSSSLTVRSSSTSTSTNIPVDIVKENVVVVDDGTQTEDKNQLTNLIDNSIEYI